MPSEDFTRTLCKQILQRCGNTPAEVLISVENNALTRFANNAIHQNVAESNLTLTARLLLGKQSGVATTNRVDPAALDEVVARARLNAQASPENPDDPGLADPAEYLSVQVFDSSTAEYSPLQRAREVAAVCQLAKEKRVNASGAFSTGYYEIALANSQGVFAYHVATQADFQTVVMSEDSSGRAHASGWRVADLAPQALGQEAIEKAERGRDPRPLEPGEYTVVFDPYVTQDLVFMLAYSGMGALTVQEGRSWMNDRIGTKAMSAQVSIWDDGLDPAGIPMPFDFEGVPKQRVDLVKEGIVRGPVFDRYTARKDGVSSTGHRMPSAWRSWGPLPTNIFFSTGDSNVAEMIRATRRGLYITRFWYTRVVHPRDCVVTGMTRDGVFLIENGELAYAVKNLRFTQSYVSALNEVEMIGRETRLLGSEYTIASVRVPALKIARFNFTGATA